MPSSVRSQRNGDDKTRQIAQEILVGKKPDAIRHGALAELSTGLRQHISAPIKHGGFLQQVNGIFQRHGHVCAQALHLRLRAQRCGFVAQSLDACRCPLNQIPN
ncbi:hypothetical protein [Cupriavidus sp. CP313]